MDGFHRKVGDSGAREGYIKGKAQTRAVAWRTGYTVRLLLDIAGLRFEIGISWLNTLGLFTAGVGRLAGGAQ